MIGGAEDVSAGIGLPYCHSLFTIAHCPSITIALFFDDLMPRDKITIALIGDGGEDFGTDFENSGFRSKIGRKRERRKEPRVRREARPFLTCLHVEVLIKK